MKNEIYVNIWKCTFYDATLFLITGEHPIPDCEFVIINKLIYNYLMCYHGVLLQFFRCFFTITKKLGPLITD